MSDNPHRSRLLADLPFDVLLNILNECDVGDVLNLSATCKRLNEASGEYQTWLNQATRMQIHVPTDIVPPTVELKNWVISWARSNELWVKPRDVNGDRSLSLHWFNMRQEDPDDQFFTRFVMANLVPGGKFMVVLYTDCQIDLKEIKIKSEGKWDLQDVVKYKQDDPDEFRMGSWSQLLTETGAGRPFVACVDQEQENLLVFLVDHVAGVIERKQVVKLGGAFHRLHGIHARGKIILCFYEHSRGWGIAVSELGPAPALKHFALNTNLSAEPRETRSFMVSENAVVICDAEGIYLYHIPELGSAEDFPTLSPVWDWPGESEWYCGSVCMTSSHNFVFYLQGTSGTHTISFRLDACGRDPAVMEHYIAEKLPAYLTSLREDDHRFVMKGRKGLYYTVGGAVSYTQTEFDTRLLGREGSAGGFSAEVRVPEDPEWDEYEVTLADFDERTGRVLIGADRLGMLNTDKGIRIYLADVPP